MKSSQIIFAALTTSLLMSASAFARGPGQAQQGTAAGTAAQSRSGFAGAASTAGTRTVTATRAQLHTPGTGLTDSSLATGRPTTAGVPRGIHTPGTGLTTSTTDSTAVVAQ